MLHLWANVILTSFRNSSSASIVPRGSSLHAGSVHRSASTANVTLIKGASYSHTDLLAMQSLSRSASPLPSMLNAKFGKVKKSNGLIQDTDDDWATDLDDSAIAAERRRHNLIKSIEHRPALVDGAPLKKTYSFPSYPSLKIKGSGLKPQHRDILQDPASLLNSIYHPTVPEGNENESVLEEVNSRIARINRFKRVLQGTNIDLSSLRKLSWNGIPEELRPMVWQLLLGYLPAHADRRVATLARKRQEYVDAVGQAWRRGPKGLEQTIWHQIHIDVPRTNPFIRLYQFPATQRSLERILYVWAIRHPASGYVQGINDLVTPFFQVFLSAYINDEPEQFDPGSLPKEIVDAVEADTFWCLSKLLDGIQDNYIHTQPGIQRQVANLRELTTRIDANLARHLFDEGVEFIQFSFRWMNCLLMREISVKCTIRMWDTYMVAYIPLSKYI